MKLAAVQYRPPRSRPTRARADLVRLAHAAVDAGAGMVVLPELATSGYVWPSAQAILPVAEPPDGPTFQALRAVAQRGAWIVCGYVERDPDGGLYNAALVIRPDGELALSYRKVLLFELDTTWARPGTRRALVRTEAGEVAPAICMDLNDPRLQTWLAMVQPDVLAFCTSWVEEGYDVHAYWRSQLRAWRGWMVAADRWGEESGVRFAGRSAIVAPGGRVAASAEAEGDAVVVVDTEEWGRAHGADSVQTSADRSRWG
ncbi:carbon-nitrogen hydrolase family protein [Myxococcota bacterium]|nr:carbon-nitrogen hydrolase family protein [Myxococcota bacterium]